MPKEIQYATLEFVYGSNILLLPHATACKVLALLEGARSIKDDWSESRISLSRNFEYVMKPITDEKVTGMLKAQLMGITYKEYLESLEKIDESESESASG